MDRMGQFMKEFVELLGAEYFVRLAPNLLKTWNETPAMGRMLATPHIINLFGDEQLLQDLKENDLEGLEEAFTSNAVSADLFDGREFAEILQELDDDEYDDLRARGVRLCLLVQLP